MKRTLNLTELSDYIDIHKRTLYRMIKDKRFPVQPIKGSKPRRWNTEHVEAWLASGGQFSDA